MQWHSVHEHVVDPISVDEPENDVQPSWTVEAAGEQKLPRSVEGGPPQALTRRLPHQTPYPLQPISLRRSVDQALPRTKISRHGH